MQCQSRNEKVCVGTVGKLLVRVSGRQAVRVYTTLRPQTELETACTCRAARNMEGRLVPRDCDSG